MTLPLHLPDYATLLLEIQHGMSGANDWIAWPRPLGVSNLWVILVGSGGSGGGGFLAAAGNARGGGAGGGSGAVAVGSFSAAFFPELVYLRNGAGGLSPAGAVAGNPGALSYLARYPSTAVADLLLVSGAVAAQGGAAGAGAGTATAGAAGTVATIANCILGGQGSRSLSAGAIGAVGGGVNAAGSSIAAFAANITCGGASGGGVTATDRAGGNITAAGPLFLVPGGAAGSNAGSPGVQLLKPLCSSGGAGGGSSNAGAGGVGGQGAFGSGGGGGGGGVSGGDGGRGGDGRILIYGF